MKFLIIFCVIFFLHSRTYSQVDTLNLSKGKIELKSKHIILIQYGIPLFFSTHKFKFQNEGNNSFRNIGIYGKNLRPYFQSKPIALEYLNQYRNTRKAGVIQMIAGPVLSGIAIIKAVNYTNKHESSRSSEFDMPDSVPFLAVTGGLLMLSGSITYSFGTTKKIRTAISLYNSK